MGKIGNVKARKKRMSIEGFGYLYLSLLKFSEDFTQPQALDICYDLYVACTDTLRWDFPQMRFEEKRKKEFVSCIQLAERAYRTSVQLYKSLDFLLRHINDKCLNARQNAVVHDMRRYVEEKALYFRMATGVELRSDATVYSACAYSLIPLENEPKRVCKK